MLLAAILSAIVSDPGNILLIVMDDIANDYIGVYEEGPDEHQPLTPNIDALATEGVRFANCYSNPLCSPTRATILTGRYGFRTQIGAAIKRDSTFGLDPSETTLAELLSQAGFSCAMVGKWHLGEGNPFFDPILHGFDLFAGMKSGGFPRNYWDWERWLVYPWVSQLDPPTGYSTTELTDNALALINSLPEPWFVCLCYHAVHKPYHEPPAELHSYDNPQTNHELFGAMVEAMDTEMGRVLDQVDRSDTTIVLLGDNGSPPGVGQIPGRAKATLYEGGVNVPLIIAGESVPVHGGVAHALVNTTDLFQTVLDMIGVTGSAEDSISFLQTLSDPSAATKREWVYAERFVPNGDGPYYVFNRMARSKRYKLIKRYIPAQQEFYDLATATPGEDGEPLNISNLTSDQQDAYDRLQALVDGMGERP